MTADQRGTAGSTDRLLDVARGIQLASRSQLISVLVWHWIKTTSFWAVVAHTDAGRWLDRVTLGFVGTTWIASLVMIAGFVALVLASPGLRLLDIGLTSEGVGAAIGAVLSLWLLGNATLYIYGLLGEGIDLHPAWADRHGLPLLGHTAAQLFGSAISEELLFRAILFRQIYLRMVPWLRCSAATAFAVTSVYFAVSHIFAIAHQGLPMEDAAVRLAQLIILGASYNALYVRTKNLWLVAGVHGLCNAPLPLLSSAVPLDVVIGALAVVLFLTWPNLVSLLPLAIKRR
jgi:hypothetical protein